MGFNIPGGGAKYSPPQKSAPALLNPGPPPAPPPQHSAPALLNPAHVYQAPVHSAPALLNPAPNQVHQNPMPVPRGGTDAQSSGPGYGSAQANAYKQSPNYRLAIAQTFLHQAAKQQSLIVKGAVSNPSYEGNIVLNLLHGRAASAGFDFGKLLSAYGVDLGAKGMKDSGIGRDVTLSSLAAAAPGGGIGGAGSKGAGVLGMGTVTPFASGTFGRQLAENTGKDAVNLPAEAVTTVGTLGGDVFSGNIKKLGSDLLAQPKQFLQDPIGTTLNHPLDTGLMVAGVAHGLTRAAGGVVRRVAPDSSLGKAVTPSVPPSVHLTGNLTHERPAYSPYPLIKAGQKAVEGSLYKRKNGVLVPRTDHLRESLLRHEVSRSLVGARERIRRAGVQNQVKAHAQSVVQGTVGKAVHGVKTALAYNPGGALIHGANVLARVADHTIRTPATFFTDLQKHIDSTIAKRSALEGRPQALAEHDQYVKTLQAARNDKGLNNPKNIAKLFDAAHTYARDIKPLQNEAFGHGHYGDFTQEALLRRELQPVVLSHMPGARLDPKLGMVQDTKIGPRPLSTLEMKKFDEKQTGGRPLAYTSHGAPKGDSAYYTNQQKYPARAIQKNTGFAFQHGLSDPTHEALLQHRVELENAINAHRSMDKILSSTAHGHPQGGYWNTHKDAKADAPPGYVPVQVGRMVSKNPSASEFDSWWGSPHSAQGPMAPTPDNFSHEANIRSLNLNERLRDPGTPGKFGLMDKIVVDQLRQHENQISPNTFMRAARATTGQFRKVALGTSVKHIPGVAQEGLIRDIGAGVFVQHLASGKNVFKELEKIDPRLAAERKVELSGGMLAGMTRALATRQGSRHFSGTVLGPPMKAVESFFKAPGARQMSTAWNAWTRTVIDGTKHALEENQQTAALGKAMQNHVGKIMWLQGKAAQEAARGLVSDQTARQLRAEVQRTMGTWTDLTPSGQTAMMFSPFGMWWVNSVKWLARLPIDQPLKTGALAMATTGTEKQRQAEGLDMFSPGHLAGYLQGSIPAGNKLIGQQYYSPFGVAGDAPGTAASLIEPTLIPALLAMMGDNYLGHGLRSPNDPKGQGTPNVGERSLVALNSVLSNFLPLYTKAQTVATGGASTWDTSTLLNPQTKGPNPGPAAGLWKAVQPLKQYHNPGVKLSTTGKADPFKAPKSSKPDPFASKASVGSGGPDPFK